MGVIFKMLARPWLRGWARIRAARVGRIPWVCLTWGCIGLGSAGVVLPLLPTTPFILVAAWAAPKASPRLSHWLDQHPVFGPNLHAWRTQRAIPRKAKVVAVILLLSSWWILFFLGTNKVLLSALTVLFLSVTVFILTRPDARDHGDSHEQKMSPVLCKRKGIEKQKARRLRETPRNNRNENTVKRKR